MPFSRQNPSPRYQDLLALYRQMHVEGDAANGLSAADTFSGGSLRTSVEIIGQLVTRYQAKSLLDYGAGKAEAHISAKLTLPDGTAREGLKSIWGLDEVALFDPGVANYGDLPDRQFDAVISTDVLEHCPEEDVDWILEEILSIAKSFVYCTVAVYPAKKHLPNGENAHITVKSPGWWVDRFEAAHDHWPEIHYHLAVVHAGNRITYTEG